MSVSSLYPQSRITVCVELCHLFFVCVYLLYVRPHEPHVSLHIRHHKLYCYQNMVVIYIYLVQQTEEKMMIIKIRFVDLQCAKKN